MNRARFKGVLDLIRAGYLDLVDLRNTHLKRAPIFTHSYDFAIPDGRPAIPLIEGPWLKPSLEFRGWNSDADKREVVKNALKGFDSLMKRLAEKPRSNMIHVATEGTLTDDQWANELHPTPEGFRIIARKFRDALKAKFPGRV